MISAHKLPAGWQIKSIGSFSKVTTGATPLRAKQERYFTEGNIPWIKTTDLNNSEIFDSEERITEVAVKENSCSILPENTVLIAMYGGFRQIGRTGILRIPAATNQALSAVRVDEREALPDFLLHYLNGNVDQWKRLAASSRKDPNITRQDVLDYEVVLPPIAQQEKIIVAATTWDEAISLQTRQLQQLRRRKYGIAQKLLLGKKRLIEFQRREWDMQPIGNVAQQVSQRNAGGTSLTVLSCTKYDGLVDSLTYFGRKIYSDDLSSYKVVPRNTFAYATNHIEEGSIGYQSTYDKALISPMYTVFRTDAKRIDDAFLYHLLKSDTYVEIYRRNMSGSIDRRGGLRWADFSQITIPAIELDEQRAIAEVLTIAADEIRLNERKLEALREQKRGLLQQLLTGEILLS